MAKHNSTYKDWHKPISHMRTDKKILESVGVWKGGVPNGIEMILRKEDGKQMIISLNALDTAVLRMQIDFYMGKAVSRQDYGLHPVENRLINE